LTAKTVIPRAQVSADVDSAIDHYLAEGASDAALGSIDALEQAYAHLSRNAATGSPRYGHELGLPGLRAWPLTTYPFLVFHLEREDHIDVWRVLHTRRDIPQRMTEPDSH
jgi:toxin ParE1/3/4